MSEIVWPRGGSPSNGHFKVLNRLTGCAMGEILRIGTR